MIAARIRPKEPQDRRGNQLAPEGEPRELDETDIWRRNVRGVEFTDSGHGGVAQLGILLRSGEPALI